MLKAYWCDECDLYAAESAQQAASLWREAVGEDEPLDEGYPRELTDKELDAPQPEFDEDERRTGGTTSIRRMLAEHGDEPGWLAGTVW
jgi:hypothetical protein